MGAPYNPERAHGAPKHPYPQWPQGVGAGGERERGDPNPARECGGENLTERGGSRALAKANRRRSPPFREARFRERELALVSVAKPSREEIPT